MYKPEGNDKDKYQPLDFARDARNEALDCSPGLACTFTY